MALKICALLAAFCCLALTPETPLAGDPGVEPVALPSSPQRAQPCFVAGLRCLDLSDEPFVPCLVGTARCKPDVEVRELVSRTAGRHAD